MAGRGKHGLRDESGRGRPEYLGVRRGGCCWPEAECADCEMNQAGDGLSTLVLGETVVDGLARNAQIAR